MFVIDGIFKYIYEEFMRLCYSKIILSFWLLSYITYFLQPLNIVYF